MDTVRNVSHFQSMYSVAILDIIIELETFFSGR